MDQVVEKFLEYGLLGLVALAALWLAWRKDREHKTVVEEKDALHAGHAARLETLQKDHQAEMMALEERYITKAETWMQKHHDLAVAQNEVLVSMERRYGK